MCSETILRFVFLMLQEGSCQLLTIKTPLRNKYLILTGLHLIREDMKNNV
jgi:hypothetical protein